jgi:hypothetical protein
MKPIDKLSLTRRRGRANVEVKPTSDMPSSPFQVRERPPKAVESMARLLLTTPGRRTAMPRMKPKVKLPRFSLIFLED